jgi:putative ABC transport system permease protein
MRRRLSVFAIVREALRAIARHAMRSALSALGIMIGIAAVVWVVAIGTAASARSEEQLIALGNNLVWVEAGSRNVAGVRTGTKGTTSLTLGDAFAIQSEVPQIVRMSPQIDGSAVTQFENRNWSTRWRGIANDYLYIKRYDLASGGTFSDDDVERSRNVCLVGETVRRQLFGEEDPVGQVIRVAGQPFDVVGLLSPKGQSATGQDQDDTIFVPYTTAQKKLRGGAFAWLDDVVCSAESAEATKPAADAIMTLMRQRHRIGVDDEDDFNIRHPEEVIKAQMETSRTFSTLLLSIASVSLLVGGIGIMNVMLASVAERTREIGVRLAIGATEWAVQLQFLLEAAFLSILGGLAGVAISAAGASAIGLFIGWQLSIPLQAVATAVGFSLAVGVIFGFVPARRASKLDPIEALRSD